MKIKTNIRINKTLIPPNLLPPALSQILLIQSTHHFSKLKKLFVELSSFQEGFWKNFGKSAKYCQKCTEIFREFWQNIRECTANFNTHIPTIPFSWEAIVRETESSISQHVSRSVSLKRLEKHPTQAGGCSNTYFKMVQTSKTLLYLELQHNAESILFLKIMQQQQMLTELYTRQYLSQIHKKMDHLGESKKRVH